MTLDLKLGTRHKREREEMAGAEKGSGQEMSKRRKADKTETI